VAPQELRTGQDADQRSRNGWQTDKQLTSMRRVDDNMQAFFVGLFKENVEQFSHS